LVHVGAHLPGLVTPDEPTVMDRALGLLHGRIPNQWDWPTGAMEALAGAVGLGRAITPWLSGTPWLFGRALFVVISLAVVVLTGLVGAQLADGLRDRRVVAIGAAALLAVSYVSVRLSRSIQPDHLQLCFMLGSLLCALVYDRRRTRARSTLAGAGLLAGLAGATKYLGVLALGPAVVSVLWTRWAPR